MNGKSTGGFESQREEAVSWKPLYENAGKVHPQADSVNVYAGSRIRGHALSGREKSSEDCF